MGFRVKALGFAALWALSCEPKSRDRPLRRRGTPLCFKLSLGFNTSCRVPIYALGLRVRVRVRVRV